MAESLEFPYSCEHMGCNAKFRTQKEKLNHHNQMEPDCLIERQELLKLIQRYKILLKHIIKENDINPSENEVILNLKSIYEETQGKIIDIDFFGLFEFTLQSPINILNLPEHSINLKNTIWPFIILARTGLAFKNGLYVFMLRQFFRGIPDSLEESAYIDGSGDFRTFIQIILPMSVPMMITVFLFSFCWQWTDTFYTSMFFTNIKEAPLMLSQITEIPKSLDTEYAGQTLYETAIRNTCGIMIIAPLVVLYVFLQRYLVEGIERSGLTAE